MVAALLVLAAAVAQPLPRLADADRDAALRSPRTVHYDERTIPRAYAHAGGFHSPSHNMSADPTDSGLRHGEGGNANVQFPWRFGGGLDHSPGMPSPNSAPLRCSPPSTTRTARTARGPHSEGWPPWPGCRGYRSRWWPTCSARSRSATPPGPPGRDPAQVIPIAEVAPTLARGASAMSPAGAALAAATLASLVSGGAGWLLAGRGADRPQTQPPPPAAEVVIEAQPAGRDDLLGYLQERGAHLPPPGGSTR